MSTRRGREPQGLGPALLRLWGVYSPNSLLHESATGGELHRHWAFFIPPLLHIARRGPHIAPLLTSFEQIEDQDDTKEGKRTPAVPSVTTGPLPEEGSLKPPRQRAYLRVSPGFACLGEGPCSWLPPGGPSVSPLLERVPLG